MEKYWNIDAPCYQDWCQMDVEDGGRYCQSCCKTVIDFSDWDTRNILKYLNTHTSICGRFQTDQLMLMEHYTKEPIILLLSRSPLNLLQKVAVLIIFCFSLSIGTEVFAQQQAQPFHQSSSGQYIHRNLKPAIFKKGHSNHQKDTGSVKKDLDYSKSLIMGFVAPSGRTTLPELRPKEKPNAMPNLKAARPER